MELAQSFYEIGWYMTDVALVRCPWTSADPLYQAYHDFEWGNPVSDDIRLFEKISLEGFQSGLSWITILKKRENFRKAFVGFDYTIIADFSDEDIERLVLDAGIVRHRGKIRSVVNNAQCAIAIIEEFGSLAKYFWQFEPAPSERPQDLSWDSLRQIASTAASTAMSKDLKKRGFSFVGPTTCYAFMQSMGMVNDHMEGCHCRDALEVKRAAFTRP